MAELQTQLNDQENEENKQNNIVETPEVLPKKRPDVKVDIKPPTETEEMVIKVQPFANLSNPETRAIVQGDIEKQKQEQTITFDQLKSGEVTEVGGTKIDNVTRRAAQAGHVESIIKLEKLAKAAKDSGLPKSQEVMIGGMREGKLLPFTGLSEDQVTDLVGYTTGRMKVLNALKEIDPSTNEPRVDDKVVQQLMVDYFSTGNFYTEMSRRLAEAGRGSVLLPVLAHMGYHLIGAATDAIDDPFYIRSKLLDQEVEDEKFLDSWNSRVPSMAKFFEQYKSVVEKALPGVTTASAINDDLKKIYIDVYGEDAYRREFTIKNPATGQEFVRSGSATSNQIVFQQNNEGAQILLSGSNSLISIINTLNNKN